MTSKRRQISIFFYFFSALGLLWLSSELIYFVISTNAKVNPFNGVKEFDFAAFYYFTRKPLVILLNIVTLLGMIGHLFYTLIYAISEMNLSASLKNSLKIGLVLLAILFTLLLVQMIGGI